MRTSLSPGETFASDFEIERVLAAGGMGAVYVAVQKSTGARRALKLMHAQLRDDPKLRARFEQEARVGARIESDHVVQVLAAGVDEATAMPWLAMELLQGEDLARAMKRRADAGNARFTPAEVAEIGEQIAHALGAAHRAHVVHRDLKPENVFLASARRAGATTIVKVLDFGIAKIVAETQSSATASIGTPLWMAPEQTDPSAKVGPPADVWSFGLLVYALLVGRSFWLEDHGDRTSLQALLREVLVDPLPRASERAAAQGAPEALPRGFDDWFARAVDRDPAHRFADADAAWKALTPLLLPPPPPRRSADVTEVASLPVPPPPPPPPPRPRADAIAPRADRTRGWDDDGAASARPFDAGKTEVALIPASPARVAGGDDGMPTGQRLMVAVVVLLGAIAVGAMVYSVRTRGGDPEPSHRRAIASTSEGSAAPAPTPEPPTPAPTPSAEATTDVAPAKIQASHILVSWKGASRSTQTRTKADALARITEARAKIVAGMSFADAAAAYGEDSTKTRGGDLGMFGKGMMVKPFEDAAFALKVGELSGVVETDFGYHLILRTK